MFISWIGLDACIGIYVLLVIVRVGSREGRSDPGRGRSDPGRGRSDLRKGEE